MKEPEMVLVQGGTFSMGSNDGENDEKPVHSVTVSSFYISKYEITFTAYDAFCDATGHTRPDDNGWGRGNRPVINVSWDDAMAYCGWLSYKTGKKYRLPTEAEWEFAASGGNKGQGHTYSGGDYVEVFAWCSSNSGNQTHPVGQKEPNELGLYDMSGNVWEWCSDWYGDYGSYSQTDPQGASSGTFRVLRGGSWSLYPRYCRVARRGNATPDLRNYFNGFRVVCVP
jgi:formylglycine-generating enzyme required for sulfatase activity